MTNKEGAGDKGKRFLEKMGEIKNWIDHMGADAIVLISDDHFNSYYYDHMPAFTIGIGECEGWGDWELPEYKIPVDKELAKYILDSGLENGIDFSFSMSMKVDHGHTQGIYFLNPDLKIPVVPITINTSAPPLPTMDRCFQLGEILRKAITSWGPDKKVAIIASGGLSHWVPTPKIDSSKAEDQELIQILLHGRRAIADLEQYKESRKNRVTEIKAGPVNEEWDRKFLDDIMQGNISGLRKWTYEEIEESGGNGGQEIRNWLVLLGAVQDFKPEIVYYEPIPEWVTGMGIVKFKSE
jgi:2,3-dihydroxyphenylpropionate 1,2-dioxygenase